MKKKYLDFASPKKENIFRIKSQEKSIVREDLIIGNNPQEVEKKKKVKNFRVLKKDISNASVLNCSKCEIESKQSLNLYPFIRNYKGRSFQ